MRNKLTAILILAFVVCVTTYAQVLPKKLAKEAPNLEAYYISGDYYKGISILDNIIEYYESVPGDDAKVASAPYYVMKASFLMALGNALPMAEEQISKGVKLAAAKGEDTYEYAQIHLSITDTYLQHDYVKNALTYFNETKKLLTDLDKEKLNEELSIIETHLFFKQGYYSKAYTSARALTGAIKDNISKYYEYTDPKTGKIKKKKYKKADYVYLQRKLANHLNFIGEILLEKGEYKAADSALKVAETWIVKEIGKSDISYVDNQYLRGLHLYYLEVYHEALPYFYTSSSFLTKSKYGFRYQPQTPFYYQLLSKIMECNWIANNDEDVRGRRNQYYSEIKRFFGKENLFNVRIDFLDINRLIIKTSYLDAKALLESLISENKINREHPLYIIYLQYAKEIYANLDEVKKASEAQDRLLKLKEKLYPIESPIYNVENIQKAILKIEYDNDISEAGAIFKESYLNIYLKEYYPTHYQFLLFNNSYAKFLELKEDYKGAIAQLKVGYDVAERYYDYKKTDRLAIQATKLAQMHFDTGNMTEAEEYNNICQKVYAITENKQKRSLADYLIFLGKYNLLIGNISKAEINFKEAYDLIWSSEKEKKKKFRKDVDISEFTSLYLAKGEYSKLETELLKAIKTKEDIFGPDHRVLLNTIKNITDLYIRTGDFTKAGKTIQRAITITKSSFGENSINYMSCLILQAKLYAALGNYSEAIKMYETILKKQEKFYGSRSNIYIAETLTGLALSKLLAGDKSETVYNLLVEAALIAQEFNKGNISNKVRMSPKYAEALKNLAYYHIETNSLEKALELIQKAEGIYIELDLDKNNEQIADIEVLKGEIYKKQGNFDQAIKSFEDAKTKYKNKFSKDHPEYVYALSKLGQIYYIKKDHQKAIDILNETTEYYLSFIDNYFTWLSESEKSKFWRKIKNDFEFYNTLAFKYQANDSKLTQNVYNFTLATKALLLNSSIQLRQAIVSSNDQVLIDQFNEWIDLREELTAKLSYTDDQLKEMGEQTKEEIDKKLNVLEKELSEKSIAFSQNNSNSKKKNTRTTWQDVKSQLKENEFAVEIVRYRFYENNFTDSVIYAALILSPDSKKGPEVVMLPNGSDLEKKYIKYYQNTTKHHLSDDVTYAQYWAPIKAKIPDGAKIYLSVEGVYNELNIESLMNTNGKYVLEENLIVLISNSKDLVKSPTSGITSQTSVTKNEATLVGNPSFYLSNDKNKDHENTNSAQAIKQLPGAEKEIDLVNNVLKSKGWKTNVYMYENASEDTVKQIKSPKILHFATHGFFYADENTGDENMTSGLEEKRAVINPLLKSGLLMKNAGDIIETKKIYDFNSESGILTAYEAMNLDLTSTEMVVLSACETGLGDIQIGEGVFGLQRAFIVAGAQTVIMSLFKVSDDVTMRLMDTFYTKWLELGDKQLAFIEAKKEIKTQFPDRIYWGSFVMIGNN